jgi:hypothetical protein
MRYCCSCVAASPSSTATARSVEVAPPDTPQSIMTAIANPNLIPPGPPNITHPEPTDNALDDDMTFTGAWCTPIDYHFHANVTVTGFFSLSLPPLSGRNPHSHLLPHLSLRGRIRGTIKTTMTKSKSKGKIHTTMTQFQIKK